MKHPIKKLPINWQANSQSVRPILSADASRSEQRQELVRALKSLETNLPKSLEWLLKFGLELGRAVGIWLLVPTIALASFVLLRGEHVLYPGLGPVVSFAILTKLLHSGSGASWWAGLHGPLLYCLAVAVGHFDQLTYAPADSLQSFGEIAFLSFNHPITGWHWLGGTLMAVTSFSYNFTNVCPSTCPRRCAFNFRQRMQRARQSFTPALAALINLGRAVATLVRGLFGVGFQLIHMLALRVWKYWKVSRVPRAPIKPGKSTGYKSPAPCAQENPITLEKYLNQSVPLPPRSPVGFSRTDPGSGMQSSTFYWN